MRAADLIAVVITSGLATALVGQIGSAVRALWHARQGRETEAQAARRTRATALDRGAPLGDLPRGPGETPIGDLADDD